MHVCSNKDMQVRVKPQKGVEFDTYYMGINRKTFPLEIIAPEKLILVQKHIQLV